MAAVGYLRLIRESSEFGVRLVDIKVAIVQRKRKKANVFVYRKTLHVLFVLISLKIVYDETFLFVAGAEVARKVA